MLPGVELIQGQKQPGVRVRGLQAAQSQHVFAELHQRLGPGLQTRQFQDHVDQHARAGIRRAPGVERGGALLVQAAHQGLGERIHPPVIDLGKRANRRDRLERRVRAQTGRPAATGLLELGQCGGREVQRS
jgi:hypothetical protein